MWFTCTDGGDDTVKVDEEEEVREYRVKCLNNLAAAQLKLEQYEEALSTSRDVLTLEQNNVKALFRTGKVRMDFAGLTHANQSIWPGPFQVQRVTSLTLFKKDLWSALLPVVVPSTVAQQQIFWFFSSCQTRVNTKRPWRSLKRPWNWSLPLRWDCVLRRGPPSPHLM